MEPEEYNRAEYMEHPIVGKYLHQLFHLVDDLHQETDSLPVEKSVQMLKDILRTVYTRMAMVGEMEELDSIMHMHFSHEYDPPSSDSIPSLIDYPLSTSN